MDHREAVAEYKEKIGYETMINSAAALEIILPADFNVAINQVEIGPFLQAKNELSKQNGFDFAGFMGKRVVLYTCSSETDDDLALLIYDQKIIGAWKDSTRGEDFFHTHKHQHTVRAIKSRKQGRSAAGAPSALEVMVEDAIR